MKQDLKYINSNDNIKRNLPNYPIIKTPKKILQIIEDAQSQKYKISDKIIINSIGDFPKSGIPYVCEPYKFSAEEINKLRFELFRVVTFWFILVPAHFYHLIPTELYFAALALILWTLPNLILIPLMLTISLLVKFLSHIKSVNQYKKNQKLREKHKNELDNYELQHKLYVNIREKYKKSQDYQDKYSMEITNFVSGSLNKIKFYEHDYYTEYLKKESRLNKYNKFTPKVGASEQFFLTKLEGKFEKILTNEKIDSYYPDFIIKFPNKIEIVVEIDEYYDIKYKSPIHFIDHAGQHVDSQRDDVFLDYNFCVIRFTEIQVLLNSDECCRIIEKLHLLISSGKSLVFNDLIDNFIEPCWTESESLNFAKVNKRENFLLTTLKNFRLDTSKE